MIIFSFYLTLISFFPSTHSNIHLFPKPLQNSSLTFPMNNTEYNGYNISISFKTNNNNDNDNDNNNNDINTFHFLSLKLNMLNNYTFTSSTPFLSKTYYTKNNQQDHIFFDYNLITTFPIAQCITNITSTSYELILFNFNVLINPRSHYHNCIGLSHIINDNKYSLVHSISKQNKIKENIFSFINANSSYYFNIGPNPLFNQFKFKGFCKVNSKQFKWMCYYNEIIFNNVHFDSLGSNEIVFNSGQTETFVTKKMWEFVKEVFKPFINITMCVNTRVGYYYCIRCRQGIQVEMKDFIIIIGDYVYRIPAYQMFLMYNQTNTMEFYWKYQETYCDVFSVGTSFLSLFDVVSFNYDSDSVVFYSNNMNMITTFSNYIRQQMNISKKLKLLLLVNIILMCSNMLINYYIKYQKF